MEERYWTELLQGIVGSTSNIDREMISTNYTCIPRDAAIDKNLIMLLLSGRNFVSTPNSEKKESISLLNNDGTEEYKRLSVIFEHIQQLGWEFVKNFSNNFSELTIDVGLHDITFIVNFGIEYPCCSPRIISRFFSIQDFPWDINCDLKYLVKLVLNNVKIYDEFFKAIQDIDKNSIVINAEFKNFNMLNERVINYIIPKVAIRTILINVASIGFITCQITINHLRLTQPPECQFNGSHEDVTALARKYQINQDRWSTSRSVIQNLEDMLNLSLPRPKDISTLDLSEWNNFGQHDDTDDVCDICYTCGSRNRVMCTNSKCSHFYHVHCIRAWFQSVVVFKLSFGVLYGLCPYCGSNIEIPE